MTKSNSSVCALVVTYNRKQLLKENIEALLCQSVPCDILVGDNASTDGTKEMLQPWIDDGSIVYLNTGANLGGAGGFQFLIKNAHNMGYEHFWIMDDDSIPKPDALEHLLQIAEKHPDYGFLSSRTLWIDGTLCKMNQQKFYKDAKELACGEIPCRQATFVSLLLSDQALQKAGLPYKEFFIWGDDVEYTRRLSRQFDCYYVPASKVVHKTANNEGSNIAKDDSGRLDRYRYAYRNEVFIAKKEKGSRILYQSAKILLHTWRVLSSGKPDKLKKLGIIWSASMDGLSFSPAVEYVQPVSSRTKNEEELVDPKDRKSDTTQKTMPLLAEGLLRAIPASSMPDSLQGSKPGNSELQPSFVTGNQPHTSIHSSTKEGS